jgi:methylthioribose-1-phosphate isomerase
MEPEMIMRPLEWLDDRLKIIDQTRLPEHTVFLELTDYRDVVTAIKELKVRGAPAIGVAAAYGIALGAREIQSNEVYLFREKLDKIAEAFAAARPTAVNLFKSVERMKRVTGLYDDVTTIKKALVNEAIAIHSEEETATCNISKLGAGLIKAGSAILTHCNAGPLATAGDGTALGIIIAAHREGKNINVIATETRPLLQGARLTAWELLQEGIPTTLITDSMAGYFIKQGKVDCVVVGADRIAANGDTANKIGTYTLAVLAQENGIPFYIAAPTSTVDLSIDSGAEITVEERRADEITSIAGKRIAPQGVNVANPAFDITPHRYISGIITENGIAREPYTHSLKKYSTEENEWLRHP